MNLIRLLAALAVCLMSAATLAGRAIERPGIGYSPAYVCVATTIRTDGHTKQSSLLRRSGSLRLDRHALRLTRKFKLVPQAGQSDTEIETSEREGVFLFRLYGNGAYAFKLFAPTEPLPEICFSPYESVARDAEINARYKD